MIYHMGGEGVGGKGEVGFNWRVGPEYAKMMLRKISYEKIVIFDTIYYNTKFKKDFPYKEEGGMNGIVSVCLYFGPADIFTVFGAFYLWDDFVPKLKEVMFNDEYYSQQYYTIQTYHIIECFNIHQYKEDLIYLIRILLNLYHKSNKNDF